MLTQSQWERCRMRTKWETQTLREHAGTLSNLAKAIIRVYENEINCGHFEHLCDIDSAISYVLL